MFTIMENQSSKCGSVVVKNEHENKRTDESEGPLIRFYLHLCDYAKMHKNEI